jgi:phage repressor protein C with HTH and peptisase S24 domain
MHDQTKRLYEAAKVLRNVEEPSAVARLIGISPQTLKNWESRGISMGGMLEAEQTIGCSAVWLNTGLGDMLSAREKEISVVKARRVEGESSEHVRIAQIRHVTLTVSAGITGFSAEAFDEDGPPFAVSEDWLHSNGFYARDLVAVKIRGQSMEPSMSEGDTVVINTADKKPADSKVFAVNYDGEAVVKRMIRDYGRWFLLSDNPDQNRYRRQECTAASCFVIGRVVMLQRVNL